MIKRVSFALILGVFLFSACDSEEFVVSLGQIYLITTTKDEGCAKFARSSRKHWEGTYYVRDGGLYAKARNVSLSKGRRLVMVDENGNDTPVLSIREYKAPRFEQYPKTWAYKDSVYSVSELPDEPYAKVRGYWSSFPNNGNTALSIFMSRVPQLQKSDLELKMDIYLPLDRGDALRPLLVFIHGGAFFNGDKASLGFPEWARYFAGMGYVVASVNYRLGFHLNTVSVERAGYRAVQDVNAAIVRIIHDADKYGVDPERVFVAGTSAGGITALNVAFMREDDIPRFARSEGGLMAVNQDIVEAFSIRAVGNMWGAVEDTGILGNTETAILSIHGTGDPIVPFGQGHPFEMVFGNSVIFPTMYGSGIITDLVGNGRAELIAYDVPNRHTLHIDKDNTGEEYLNPRFWEIRDALRDYFSAHMLPHPAKIQHVVDSPIFRVDDKDVRSINWKVEGGVIIRSEGAKVEALLFPDADSHSVSVSGEYQSGLTFSETVQM